LHNSILMEEVYKEIQDFDDVLFAGEIEDVWLYKVGREHLGKSITHEP
jgi:hypothetical protein